MTVPTLNLDDADILRAGQLLTDLLRGFERAIPAARVMPVVDREALAALASPRFPERGIGVAQLFEDIARDVLPNSTAIAHPRFLAYVLGPPNGVAPFADAIASTLNQNCNFWQLSPAASAIESSVLGWLAGLFALPPSAGGVLTSGGSMATLSAIAAAIADRCPVDVRRRGLQSLPAPLVLYRSEEAHRCVDKAAALLGLGLDQVRAIPVDEAFRMRTDLLADAVAADRAAGRQPFCVVASAGTVNTGAIDPIDEVAALCAAERLWLHVDGAYGALFALGRRKREVLSRCGAADSIALDPHKLLFAPLEAGCLLARDRETLVRTFRFGSPYLGAEEDPLLVNFMDRGPELSRGFKAFKIWCALRALGVQAFADAADRALELAEYMAERVRGCEALELMAPVELSAVCVRLRGIDDAGNRAALAQLVASGIALLGPVRLRGRSGIRCCIANYRTTRADIDLVVDALVELGSRARRPADTLSP
jgi:aromatic-L-amino-acid/L-tryptophan decarboxylase